MRNAIRIVWLLPLCLLCTACSNPSNPTPVRGIVKFSDDSIPTGEVAIIRFDPVDTKPAAGSPAVHVASGNIQSDGTFILSTSSDADGALPGEYKVVVNIRKSYLGQELVVPKKYTQTSTTPLSATVTRGVDPFEFVLDKK